MNSLPVLYLHFIGRDRVQCAYSILPGKWTQYTYLESSQNSSSEKGSDEFMQIFKIRLNSSLLPWLLKSSEKNDLAHIIKLQCLAHRRYFVNINWSLPVSSVIPQELNLRAVEETFVSLVFGYNFPPSHAFYYLAFLHFCVRSLGTYFYHTNLVSCLKFCLEVVEP